MPTQSQSQSQSQSHFILNRNKSINTTTTTIPISHSYPLFKPNNFTILNPKLKLFLILISMATSFLLLYSLFFFSFSPSPTSPAHHSHSRSKSCQPSLAIQQACRATRFPDACQSMLSGVEPTGTTPEHVIQAAFTVSAQNLKSGQAMVSDILVSSAQDQNRSRAAQTCLEVLSMSDHRARAASSALSQGLLRDARAWASAALSYQYDCWSGLKYVNDSSAVNSTMSFFDTTLIVSTSNVLSMLRALDALGTNPASWTPPRTERDGFWEPVVGSGFNPVFNFAGLTIDVTVSKDGSNGSYKSVQDAVDVAPENLERGKRFVIKIKEGVYEETVRVAFNKTNLVFLGDGMGTTVITGSINTGLQGITTYNTATVGKFTL